ncbi:MAG: putative glycoside hydrolase [Ruminococcus sp.]|nr:putative glycoside hydrolase [Ruminococcus sp.]MDE6796954.1 putative glycoside hydrolase [Ruminococcus sp.]
MKFRNKGRKIYKTKEKNYYGKTPLGKFFSAILTIILIGGVGVLGYSVAGPMIDYSHRQGDEEPIEKTVAEPAEDVTTEPVVMLHEKTPETDAYRGVRLSEYEISTPEAIKTAIGRIPQEQNIEYIEVPLKLSDGRIMYATEWTEFPELVTAGITLNEITRTIKKEGYKPVAYMDIFADNIIPSVYSNYGYMDTETLTAWKDGNSKTWASPYSETYMNYVNFIAQEISGAGFDKIICGDIKFPDFTERDLILLNDNRLENHLPALSSTADMLYSTVTGNNSDMLIEVDSADILSGKADILDVTGNTHTIVLDINLDGIISGVNTGRTVYEFTGTPTENISKMLYLVSGDISGFDVIVRISGNSYNTSDLLRAVWDMAETGYNSFILG